MRASLTTKYATNSHARFLETYSETRRPSGHDDIDNRSQAIGVQPGSEGGVVLLTKKTGKAHQPASHIQQSSLSASRGTRKTYSTIVKSTANRNYRTDLRKDAVARASAIRKSQKPVKESKPAKVRGAKARATATEA